MAEKTESTNETEQQQEPSRKKLPIKTALILLVVLALEGAAISAAFLFAGGPEPVQADGAAVDLAAEMEKPVEVLVVEGKFQNTRTGRAYLYDTEVFIVLKSKHREDTTGKIEAMQAQINTDVAKIFRKAEPSHLLEPELSTLTRQIKAALDARLGYDDDGEPIVMEVLIPECQRFRSDL